MCKLSNVPRFIIDDAATICFMKNGDNYSLEDYNNTIVELINSCDEYIIINNTVINIEEDEY